MDSGANFTVRALLNEGRAALAAAGLETPALDARVLLAGILKTPLSVLAAKGDAPVSAEHERAFRAALARRAAGECAAYIIGEKGFRYLTFRVTPAVLVPRPETELLVDAALEAVAGSRSRVLDLCTGSGCVAISLKYENPTLEVSASDVSGAALAVARENAKQAGVEVHFTQSDLFSAFAGAAEGFDLIVSNPPYIPSADLAGLSREVRGEPRLALDGGPDGLSLIRAIIREAPAYLREHGGLFLEADSSEMPAIRATMEADGFVDLRVWKDLAGLERIIGGFFQCGVAPA
jgi:release factor glutamine methyltransferase